MKRHDFLALIHMMSLWSLQDMLEQMDAPRYLTPETQLRENPLIVHLALTVLRLFDIIIIHSN